MLRKMYKSLSLPLLVVSLGTFGLVGCRDDKPAPTRDAAAERTPDATVKLDTVADTTPDAGIDTAPRLDTTADVPDAAIEAPAAEVTPDQASDTTDATPEVGTDAGTDVGTDAGTDAGTDSGSDAGSDSGTDAGTDSGTDAGTDGGLPLVVNGCASYEDGSAGANPNDNRYVDWNNTTFPTAPERCLQVKVGQSVIIAGDFVTHPLMGSGGDAPAIASRTTNPSGPPDEYTVTFATVGTFGYVCTVHPGTMRGAVRVVP